MEGILKVFNLVIPQRASGICETSTLTCKILLHVGVVILTCPQFLIILSSNSGSEFLSPSVLSVFSDLLPVLRS